MISWLLAVACLSLLQQLALFTDPSELAACTALTTSMAVCCGLFQAKVTLLLTWDRSGQSSLYCHAEPLPPRPKDPVRLQVK
jgi:hypothetical protein